MNRSSTNTTKQCCVCYAELRQHDFEGQNVHSKAAALYTNNESELRNLAKMELLYCYIGDRHHFDEILFHTVSVKMAVEF